MIIFQEQYVPLYEAVKADYHASEDRKVLVFVSAGEADSVCAVRILQVSLGRVRGDWGRRGCFRGRASQPWAWCGPGRGV